MTMRSYVLLCKRNKKKINDVHEDIHRLEKIMIAFSFYYHIFDRNNCCSYIEIKLKDLVRLIRENNSFIITDLEEPKYNYQKYTRRR